MNIVNTVSRNIGWGSRANILGRLPKPCYREENTTNTNVGIRIIECSNGSVDSGKEIVFFFLFSDIFFPIAVVMRFSKNDQNAYIYCATLLVNEKKKKRKRKRNVMCYYGPSTF